jgi:PAS domain S-box-containing protein
MYINAAGRDMLGLGRDEPLTGLTIPDLHTARSFETIVGEGIPAALESGVWRGETFLRHRDGREIPVSQVIVAHRSPDRPVLFSTIIRDMTEYRQLERSLMEAQKMEAIGKLAGGIAHDFNNLLAIIINTAQLLQDDLPAGSPQSADLSEIEKAGTRGAALVRALLTFARRTGGAGVPAELNAALPALVGLLDRSLGAEIELRVDLEEGLAPTPLDDAQIEQLIVNLALNAKDALPAGGRVTLRARNLTLDSAHPGVSTLGLREGAHVCIEVIDNGIGMNEDVRRRAFEPFFTTRGESRSGLGLATVYGAVTGAGGAVAIDSSPHHGTTVRVFLPAVAPEPPPPPPRPAHNHVGKTVVVIEDEDSLRALVQRILERAGYRTLAAGSAIEAGDVISADDLPDLIITDIMMPGQSGRAFIDDLRTKVGKPVRVLYMTGYSEEVSAQTGRLGTGASVLQKPFTAEELLEAVDALLRTRPA